MGDAQTEQLNSFRAFIEEAEAGAAVPPVSKDDLKLLHDVCVQMTKRYSGKDGVITLEVMAHLQPRRESGSRMAAPLPAQNADQKGFSWGMAAWH